MRKYLLVTMILALAATQSTRSQVSIGIGNWVWLLLLSAGARPLYPRKKQQRQSLPKFDPIIHFSLGYGKYILHGGLIIIY